MFHENSTQHKQAIEESIAAERRLNGTKLKPMEDFLFKDIEEKKACIISALFCAQNGIASAHYTNVLELLDAHKVPVPSSRTRPEDGNIGLMSEGVDRGFMFASSQ